MAAGTLDIPRFVGRWTVSAASHVGRVAYLILDLIRGLSEWRVWFPRTMTEAWNIGVGSLFIVLLISGFAGAVTSLQARYQFTGTIPVYYLAGVIVESIVLELGPVLTGLILAGRIGARYAAELGTMRVTEQIDALESLGRSPSSHLLIPRVIAGLVKNPALTVLADVMGNASGWFTM
jgi:phospholipid/cholesterol/gamma-HCH transport system permease protein